MKKVVIGVVVGVVAICVAVGVFWKTDTDELFCGEAKDGEMLEIPQKGAFRLNPKQKELVKKSEIISEWNRLNALCWDAKDVKRKAELEKKYPWLLNTTEKMQIEYNWAVMMNALEKSRATGK